MDLVKAIIFFTIIAFDVFIPAHSISRTSYDYASKPQVLGENTNVASRTSEIRRTILPKPIELRPISATRASVIKNTIMTATSEAKNRIQYEIDKEKIKKEKEHYKSQLEHIKDVKKKQVVQTINTKITSINKNSTDKLNAALDKLTSILTGISNQVTLISNTHDTTGLETDILEAQVTITEAQTDVLAQASKEYVLQISSNEATLKESISPVIVSFNKDINLTHQAVIKAKDAVVKIYKEIYELKLPTPTP